MQLIKKSKYDIKRLKYRNQFIIGPTKVEAHSSFKHISVNSKLHITAHPDLNVEKIVLTNRSITLIGYIINPNKPKAGNKEIIEDLIRQSDTFTAVIEATSCLVGRWALIVDFAGSVKMFHDAGGLRQVCYIGSSLSHNLWIASQPGILSDVLNLHMDKNAVSFIREFQQRTDEYWWPGDSSPYSSIKQLLPNHYLDIPTGKSIRYWPSKPLGELSFDEGIEKTADYLPKIMCAADERFDLAIGLSAGWDSRLVLSACKKIRKNISTYTAMFPRMSEKHPDIYIPARLISKLGLCHQIIKQSSKINNDFQTLFRSNIPFAHDKRIPRMQTNLDFFKLEKVAVLGNLSEIIRDPYRISSSSPGEKVSPKTISNYSLLYMANMDFAVWHFESWLNGLGTIYDINLDSLFYWEQRIGKWFAMNCLEYDSAWQEVFLPFNCRKLLVTMLSVDKKYNYHPDNTSYERLMSILWPEVLSEPINPKKKNLTRGRSIKQLVRNIMHIGESFV